jgi:putative chitinase
MAFEFDFTEEKLAQILKGNTQIPHWFKALSDILPEYQITSAKRVAAFIAQAAHESGNFTALQENLNYRAETLSKIWPSRFPPAVAAQYAHNPEMIANRAYCDRMGNGPEASGDGFKYCGRGLFQLTGKDNYQNFADSLETDLDKVAEYMHTFEGAVQSACWFWETNNLNRFADSGDIKGMTKVINGGYLGLEERLSHYNHAIDVLES